MDIRRTNPTIYHYHFLKEAYPWNWGSEEKFIWKHIKDPYASKDVYEYVSDSGQLVGVLFARKLPFRYNNNIYHYLSFMDFAVEKQHRNNRIISTIEKLAIEDFEVPVAIGTASKELYERVYKSKEIFTILKGIELKSNQKSQDFEVTDDFTFISQILNENTSNYYVPRTEGYVKWISQNPDYQQTIFVQNRDYLVGIGITDKAAHVIEMSDVSANSFDWAMKVATNYHHHIKIDLPSEVNLDLSSYDVLSQKDIYIVMQPYSDMGKELIAADGVKWIPKVDRR